MSDVTFESPAGPPMAGAALTITDESNVTKARVVGDAGPPMGTADHVGGNLRFSTSPGEWTVLGALPDGGIDLTHVRVVFQLTGDDARALLAKVCALDFDDGMFPSGRAARTSVAGVATEIVRDDQDGERSYLLVCSRSFGGYLWSVLADQAAEFGVVASGS